eukprot:351491-Chlamydomonas_euryale.AAC.34
MRACAAARPPRGHHARHVASKPPLLDGGWAACGGARDTCGTTRLLRRRADADNAWCDAAWRRHPCAMDTASMPREGRIQGRAQPAASRRTPARQHGGSGASLIDCATAGGPVGVPAGAAPATAAVRGWLLLLALTNAHQRAGANRPNWRAT